MESYIIILYTIRTYLSLTSVVRLYEERERERESTAKF